MSTRQREWNQFEAVILLEGFLDALCGKLSREDSISRVSHDLREMACQQGIEIDETFRNEAGITFQMHSMESAFRGYTVFKPATKLFSETVELYRKNNPEYKRLLEAAKAIINGEMLFTENKEGSLKTEFMKYLGTKVSSAQMSESYWCYDEIEKYCLKRGLLEKPLFETTDLKRLKNIREVIDNSASFRFTHRGTKTKISAAFYFYYKFICEKTEEEEKTAKLQLDKGNALTRTNNDIRLLKKYPVIFKRVFYVLQDSTINGNGLTSNEIQDLTQRIARASEIEDILDNASWANFKDGKYWFSNDIVYHNNIITESVIEETNVVEIVNESQKELKNQREEIIDFKNLDDLVSTTPRYFTYFDEKHGPFSKWEELYIEFIAVICDDYPHIFKNQMSFSPNKERIDLATKDYSMIMQSPRLVPETNFFVETYISINNIARNIKYLIDKCAVDYENIEIFYYRNTQSASQKNFNPKQTKTTQNEEKNITREEYYQYLLNVLHLSQSTSRVYASAINFCEEFAKERHYRSWRLFTSDLSIAKSTAEELFSNEEFLDYNKRRHNQPRAAITNLLLFIGDKNGIEADLVNTDKIDPHYQNKSYETILKEKFRQGFRMNSSIEIHRFRKAYMDAYGKELKENDTEIINIICRLCIVNNDRAYLPEEILSDDLRAKLLQYINKSFEEGKTVLYYSALCDEFTEDFLDFPLHNNPELLKQYLGVIGSDKYYLNKNFISQESDAMLDPLTELRSCLKEHARPMKHEEIFRLLPHLPQDKIMWLLRSNKEFVSNGIEEYFHESIVQLSDEELKNIAEIIDLTIKEKDYISGNELYKAIEEKYPYILDQNQEISDFGFRDALKVKFGGKYSFTGNIISRARQQLSMSDVFGNFAKSKDSFTLTELKVFAEELGTPIYFDPVYENSLRISQEQFVSNDQAHFAISETDAVLDMICSKNYISIQSVSNFGIFPDAGHPWNIFLLEEFVAEYSEKYKLLHFRFNQYECVGAIVKRSAGYNSFDEFVVDFLSKSDVELKKEPVLELLAREGYIARRRYSNIEEILIRAKAQRNSKKVG